MPRTHRRFYLTAALGALAALILWLAPDAREAAAQTSQMRFALSPATYRVSEGDGGVTVNVVRTGDTTHAASVEYLASNNYLFAKGCGYLAWVGSAAPGSDYEKASGTLNFAPGETSKTFRVKILEDTQVESRDPETVFLSLDFSALAPPGDDPGECYGSTGIVYLHDNDPSPTPTPTPVNTSKPKIAFGSNRDGNYELYVMDDDGTNVRRLTNNLAADSDPSWSPDGTRLAFASDRDGGPAIFLMNEDGSNVTRLANATGAPQDPAWSPDGTRIAYTASRQGFSSEIYVVNVDGTGAALDVTNNAGEDFGPAWSPDGKRLAFTSRRENGTFSVYTVNADGTGAKRIVDAYSREPAWSPDGTKIAYAEGVQNGHALAVVNADGTNRKLLTSGAAFVNDLNPSWSPDGSRIAFVSSRDGYQFNYEIYSMNADGTGQTRLTNSTASETTPVWRPQPAAQAAGPVLLTEPGTTWAVALDSVTQVADPFPVVSSSNFSADRRTRVSLFASGLSTTNASDITAEAEDADGNRYALPVEHAATLPGLDWLTQVTVRLPDELDGLSYVWVTLNVRGALTNKAVITLQGKP